MSVPQRALIVHVDTIRCRYLSTSHASSSSHPSVIRVPGKIQNEVKTEHRPIGTACTHQCSGAVSHRVSIALSPPSKFAGNIFPSDSPITFIVPSPLPSDFRSAATLAGWDLVVVFVVFQYLTNPLQIWSYSLPQSKPVIQRRPFKL